MKKTKQYILPALLLVALAAWTGRKHIRNLFPVKMTFGDKIFTTADDSRKITLNDLKGKVVIVSCFQTWCGDCARETPVLNKLAETINSPAFEVVYITDEPAGKVNAFRSRFESGKILFAYSSAKWADLGIHVFPTTFLLNKKGGVIKTKMEGYDWLKEEQHIRKLIAE